ncbi:hypothetical protein B0H11DRAFT_2248605 [Mycena galericulata]|nr:hypothetical protein B0H11DRAFT_2261159 [Mycena galericulata]KAJ7446839.1 hypothetical protein B0H11DRAFT_2248605 [Mycena galericulata]
MSLPRPVRLSNDDFDALTIEVERALNSDAWSKRGRTQCTCGKSALYRCQDCTAPELCKECIVGAHVAIPFHSVLEWDESVKYYTKITLRELGLRIGLGHGGATCPNSRPGRLEAITMTGIHSVAVDYCTCANAYSRDDQIKAHGWWPLRSNFCSAMTLEQLTALIGNKAR